MGSVEVDRLVTVVQALAAAPAGELDDAVVAEELLALRRLADVAEAAYLSRLAVFDTRGVARRSEALSTRQWLRHHAHVAPGETTRAVKTAKRLTELPVVAAALAAGEIRRPHADAIVDAAALLGTDVIAGCQDALVDAARTDEPTRLRAALRGLGAATENTRAVREAEKRDQDRWLDLNTTFDGAVHLQGVLGAEDGAIVKAAVDALAAPDTTHPRAGHGVAGREDAGRGGGRDMRTSAQRRADALVELARRRLDTGDLPTTGGEAPHLNVTCDLDTLQARTGGHGELPDGTILRGEAVRRLACDANITRIITGPDSQPLDVGRTRRTATPAQRKALRIRDGDTCRFPGCDGPAAWTQAHHVTFWSNGGSTDIDEMVLLCRHHHTTVHEGGWHIHTIGPGRFVFTNPAGQPVFAARAESTRHLVTRLVHLTTQPRAGPSHSRDGRHAA